MLPKLTLTEMFLRAEIGEAFFTDTKDTVAAAYAARAGVKVSTERMLAIHPGKRELIDIVRVTVLERDDDKLTRKAKTIENTVAAVRKRMRHAG